MAANSTSTRTRQRDRTICEENDTRSKQRGGWIGQRDSHKNNNQNLFVLRMMRSLKMMMMTDWETGMRRVHYYVSTGTWAWNVVVVSRQGSSKRSSVPMSFHFSNNNNIIVAVHSGSLRCLSPASSSTLVVQLCHPPIVVEANVRGTTAGNHSGHSQGGLCVSYGSSLGRRLLFAAFQRVVNEPPRYWTWFSRSLPNKEMIKENGISTPYN